MALKKVKEEKFIVPGWMVSFSDMIVNLMCFFILLNSMGKDQESGFLGAGTGEYEDSVGAEGKPGLMPTHQTLVPLDTKGGRHAAPKIDPLDKKEWTQHTKATIDDEFDRLAHSKSKLDDLKRSFPIPLGITFAAGSSRLSDKEKQDLDSIAPTVATHPETLEIVGSVTPDECPDQKSALELSFARADAVSRRLQAAGVAPEKIVPIGVGANPANSVAGQQPKIARRVALRWRLSN